jgi:deoxyribose-phosphate aldolase
MANDLDRLVDAVVARVQHELAGPAPAAPKGSVVPQVSRGPAGATVTAPEGTKGKPRPDLGRIIDHTLLQAPTPPATTCRKICSEAVAWHFFSVCVNSVNVPFVPRAAPAAAASLSAPWWAFPLGAMTPNAKAFETTEAIRAGADEIDMVLNVGALRSRDYALVLDDIAKVVGAAQGRVVKVILETGMLTRDEKVIACALSKAAGASFVKTSTGFGAGGATVEDIALMRAVVGDELGVKASGGVRTAADADAMVAAGATRVGASSSVAIVSGGVGKAGY